MGARKILPNFPTSELWELIGSHWRLPLCVEWFDPHLAEIELANIPLLAEQKRVALELLEAIGTRQDDKVWVTRAVLGANAVRSSQADPEAIVEWLPKRQPQPVRDDYRADEFVTEFCESPYAPINDPLIMEAVWAGMQKFMLHWLLNKRRPLDLLFCRLTPLMLRGNWQSVLARWEKNQKMVTKQRYAANQQSMIGRGVGDYLCDTTVVAVDPKRKVIRWTLTCTVKEPFHDLAWKLETERKRRCGAGNYWVRSVSDQQKRQLSLALEAYEEWLKEAARPYISILLRGPKGGGSPEEYVAKRVRVMDRPAIHTETIVLSDDARVEEGGGLALESEVEALPAEVPDLRPGLEDVRDTGGNLP